ncbi:MAG: zinc ribbon domain-containing protein [Anaerovoracaceae bacterium]|jgi:hypothetical protein
MHSVESKLRKGLSNVQKGIGEGKAKFQTSQEVVSLRTSVAEKERERTILILSLGEIVYGMIRKNQLSFEEVGTIPSNIVEVDKEIYRLLNQIGEKTKKGTDLICTCGNVLSIEDKFCKKCGAKADDVSGEPLDDILCHRCQSEIDSQSKYCNCCGIKL